MSERRPLVSTWQEAEADALDVLADQVEHAILSVQRVEPKFATRPELRDAGRNYVDLYATEVENIRRQAESLRDSVAAPPQAGS
jgi:hypothetical protein